MSDLEDKHNVKISLVFHLAGKLAKCEHENAKLSYTREMTTQLHCLDCGARRDLGNEWSYPKWVDQLRKGLDGG